MEWIQVVFIQYQYPEAESVLTIVPYSIIHSVNIC